MHTGSITRSSAAPQDIASGMREASRDRAQLLSPPWVHAKNSELAGVQAYGLSCMHQQCRSDMTMPTGTICKHRQGTKESSI